VYYYIINPAAGNGKINKVQDKLKARLKDLGILGEMVKSMGSEDIGKLVQLGLERGFKTIVAVGGDGTINEIINAIHGKQITLGIIPLGNNNELAKILGIPDWQSACNVLAARKTELVDLGKIGDKLFITNISLGEEPFSMNETKGMNFFKKANFFKRIGGLGKNMMVEMAFYEGFELEAECSKVIISSGKFCNFVPSKKNINDNNLDVLLVSKLPVGRAIKYTTTKDGKIDYNYFSFFRTKAVGIKTKKPVDIFADGQKVSKTPAVIEISKKKLKVIVSRERRF